MRTRTLLAVLAPLGIVLVFGNSRVAAQPCPGGS